MENSIPEEIIEEIRLRSDIVEIISEYVSLQRKGKNYLGLCPFHSEKTPSFTVTLDKQMFYCFGCHTGGNVFTFLMKKENWTFPEAIEYLARKNGITLPEKELPAHKREEQKRRQRWEEIHELAVHFFHKVLLHEPEGEPGRAYFKSRGIDEDTIKAFRLGYAPDQWEGLITSLQKKGVKPEELVDAGLALESERSSGGSTGKRYYDRFRKRVIFSILDRRQRPVAFGGRVLDDSLPKYLNSPETEFFSKSFHLYGMHSAHQGIRNHGFAILVEGYMDVIALQKAGFSNAVASLGTALTREQAKLLWRYTRRVVICYDGDSAGIKAALRAGEILQDSGFRVDVLTLRDAKDPDEYLKNHGAKEFESELDSAGTYIEFKYRVLITEASPQTIPEKAELIDKIAPDILKVNSPAEREGYERFLSLELGLTLEAVQREIVSQEQKNSKNKGKNQYSSLKQDISVKNRDNNIRYVDSTVPLESSVSLGIYRAERVILKLVLDHPSLIARVEQQLGGEFWKVKEYKRVFELIKESPNHKLSLSGLDDSVQSKVAELLLEEMDLSQPEKLLEDCIQVILDAELDEGVDDLQARMAALEKSGDMAGAMALLREIGERLRRGKK